LRNRNAGGVRADRGGGDWSPLVRPSRHKVLMNSYAVQKRYHRLERKSALMRRTHSQ
jgi:hypothetical protein